MKNFEKFGGALIAMGYRVTPIRGGKKSPFLSGWQNKILGQDDLAQYGGAGVGVLCGQGDFPICAVDIDSYDAELTEQFAQWCRMTLGATVERVGQSPKLLMVYRAAQAGWGKVSSAGYRHPLGICRLEMLGHGQQFVAYHIHPDTGLPYEWVDVLGGLEAMPASELPVLTQEMVAQAIQVFEQMAAARGLPVVTEGSRAPTAVGDADDFLLTYEPPVGLTLERAGELLAHIAPDDYNDWLRAGMALHHEFGGSGEAMALWDRWSSNAANYRGESDIMHRWDGFGGSGRQPTTAKWLLKFGGAAERDAERQAVLGERDAVLAEIAQCTDTYTLTHELARRAGDAAGDDRGVRAELIGAIRRQFKALAKCDLPMADAKAMVAGKRSGWHTLEGDKALTEFGNAERLLRAYGDQLKFAAEVQRWYFWTGVYWVTIDDAELEHMAKQTVLGLKKLLLSGDMSAEERQAREEFIEASQRARMVQNMVLLARSDPRVMIKMADLNRDMMLLGVGNGVVDLRTGALLPPNPDDLITVITPVEYDPNAKCALFERTVLEVFHGDTGQVEFFQRLIGYSLMGQPVEDILAIPYGSGSNGKSTVLGIIRDALGMHARMASSDTFLSSASGGGAAGGAREDVLRLLGARFVYIGEPDEGSELREGLVKSMTGGEPLPARGLYSRTTVEVTPTWVAFMPTNHRPIIKGDDHGIWRRLLPIPFTRNFDADPDVVKDPTRADKLRAEMPGVLAWCVRGALAYQRDGLNPPQEVKRARDDYRSDMDLLGEWLETCCELDAQAMTLSADLWASWAAFASGRGEIRYIPSSKSLGRRLLSKGFEAFKNQGGLRGRGFKGLKIRDAAEDAENAGL